MSEIFHASSFSEWSRVVPEVGRDGLVGVYLLVDDVTPKDPQGVFKKGALVVARIDDPSISANANYFGQILSFSGTKMTGAHVDCSLSDLLPPKTFWAHQSGVTTWKLMDTQACEKDDIDEVFIEHTVRVSKQIADHGQIIRPELTDADGCIQITFSEPAIFCAAAGSSRALGLNAAIHQAQPGIGGRQDFALNSLAYGSGRSLFN